MSRAGQQASMLATEVSKTVAAAGARDRTSCKSCGAPIWMLPHDGNGKRAPIDTTPDPDGNVVIRDLNEDPDDAPDFFYHVLSAHEFSYATHYTSHFQTCRDPQPFGGKKRRGGR